MNSTASCSKIFFRIDVLKNFAIFTGRHLCCYVGVPLIIKLQAFSPATQLKRDSNTVVFLWILRNFLRAAFS